MRRACVTLGVLALASCARAARPPDAAVDLVVPPIGKATAAPSASPTAGENCHAILFADVIQKSSFGCVVDEKVSKGQGILTYPCNGSGDAEAAFGAQLYSGRIREGELELETKTELEWEGDGCRWGTTANIRGNVLKEHVIAWTYRDYVIRGTACSGSCTATANMAVRGGSKPPPADEDDNDDR